MKNWKIYQKEKQNKPPKIILRNKNKNIVKDANTDLGNKMSTSFTIPNWQFARLAYYKAKLEQKAEDMSYQDIATICLRLLLKKIRRKKCQIHRTRRRNNDDYSYTKVSVNWEADEYNSFHAKANHAKISVSFMIDIAIGMYLEYVYWMLLNPDKKKNSFGRKNDAILSEIQTTSGIYQRKTKNSTPFKLIFEEIALMQGKT